MRNADAGVRAHKERQNLGERSQKLPREALFPLTPKG